MNLLILSQHFWPESFRINELADELSNEIENVYVLTGKPNYPQGKIYPGYTSLSLSNENYKKIKIFRVPLVTRGNKSAFRLFLNYTSFILTASFLGPFLLRKLKIDCVFVYGTSPLIQGLAALPFKFFFRSKLVLWVQDLWPEDLRSTGYVKNRFILLLNKLPVMVLYFYSDLILVQSESFKQRVRNLTNTNKSIVVFPNPAERMVINNEILKNIPNKFIFMDDYFTVTFAGNIGNNQSVETIINAAYNLRQIKKILFIIVGSGSRATYMNNEIIRLGLKNIRMLGQFSPSIMPTIFHKSDALLVTLADIENLHWTVPAKIQAYMASGKPIIASLNGDGAKIIRKANCGYVSEAEDSQKLSSNIRRLYRDEASKRLELGKNGRDFACKYYDPTILVKKLVNFFENLITNKDK